MSIIAKHFLLLFPAPAIYFPKIKRTHRPLPIRIQKIRPPLQHQLTLVQMFRLVDIRCPDTVTLLMAHLMIANKDQFTVTTDFPYFLEDRQRLTT